MNGPQRPLVIVYWAITVLLFGAAGAAAVFYAPTEQTMGDVQKIFYLHLSAALCMFAACTVVFVASVGYVWQRDLRWDDLAHGGASVAVVFCSVVLLTGMVWARGAWGHWWTWSPRLTFSLILWLLFVVYLVLRPTFEPVSRRAIIAALYGIVSFLDVPLVYLSVKLLPDIHPSNVELAPAMRLTLTLWCIPMGMLCAGLIWHRTRLNARARALGAGDQPATPLGREVRA